MEALLEVHWLYLVLAAFAGGAFGAAIGALPAFCFTGIMVVAGESAALVARVLAPELGAEQLAGLESITGAVAFGPVFGPHISFAGGAAAAAYAARRGYFDTGSPYHLAKDITYAFGTKWDVLVVGGFFGVLGLVITQVSSAFGLPWDAIAVAVVLSALAHRLVFGYSLIGAVHGKGILDMGPFERGEERPDDTAAVFDHVRRAEERLAVEPWLPHQYEWAPVAFLGVVAGVLGAFIAVETGSPFLAFGISAASLFFLNLGVARFPVTHHMTLPASTIALALMATGEEVREGALVSGAGEVTALVVGGLLGLVCALFGELFQRVFYAHGDTHWDPPAAAIVFGTFLIALLYLVGVLGTPVWIPVP